MRAFGPLIVAKPCQGISVISSIVKLIRTCAGADKSAQLL